MVQEKNPRSIRRACTRSLAGHYQLSPQQTLRELADATGPDEMDDIYGAGDLIANFEQEVAELLGKESAVFMPSGTMCQQIALRIWTQRRQVPRVAFHPTSHLEIKEEQSYQRLHGIESVLVGSPSHLLTLKELQSVAEPLGALLLELPQREIGGQLPEWDELTAISAWAREHNIATHMDGARLWQCKSYYKRDYAEIATLFDSVYVSFYKDLGGIAGACLAGPADVIAEARIWQKRHGGNLIHLYPYILSGRKGLRQYLGRMETFYAKAQEIAATLSEFPQIEILPNPPQTNMMHVYVRAQYDKLREAVLALAEETGTWLFVPSAETQLPSYQKFELTVGDASLDLSAQEIRELFQQLFARLEQ
jgi:threonine aldolase